VHMRHMPLKRQYAVGRCKPRKREASSVAASAYLRTYETYALKEAGGGTQMHAQEGAQLSSADAFVPNLLLTQSLI
jgi:hypothetical protein